MWADQIDTIEAERLCRLWRPQGYTSAADLRALLEEIAARRRWFRACQVQWARGQGRVA